MTCFPTSNALRVRVRVRCVTDARRWEDEYPSFGSELEKIQTKWTFEVMRKAKAKMKSRFLTVDLEHKEFVQARKEGQRAKALACVQVIKQDQKRARMIYADMRKHLAIDYTFASALERDRFREAALLLTRPQQEWAESFDDLRVFVGTWNMGDALPPRDLSAWLVPGFDIYAISTQEGEYAVSDGIEAVDHWFSTVSRQLGQAYVKLAYRSLLSIRLLVMVKRSLYYSITDVALSKEATGLAHVVGNKGGVACSFRIHDTTFAFIGSHLAAHQSKVEARNSDYFEIVSGLALDSTSQFDVQSGFNYTFWCGDLNYRIDGELDQVLQLVGEK
jgi:phosphatidylinositol-3,4,5-trisphosphate 5-phosphatase 1